MSNIEWKPRDIIAIFVLAGGFILLGLGIDHVVGGVVIMVVSFYFGLNLPKPKEN